MVSGLNVGQWAGRLSPLVVATSPAPVQHQIVWQLHLPLLSTLAACFTCGLAVGGISACTLGRILPSSGHLKGYRCHEKRGLLADDHPEGYKCAMCWTDVRLHQRCGTTGDRATCYHRLHRFPGPDFSSKRLHSFFAHNATAGGGIVGNQRLLAQLEQSVCEDLNAVDNAFVRQI